MKPFLKDKIKFFQKILKYESQKFASFNKSGKQIWKKILTA